MRTLRTETKSMTRAAVSLPLAAVTGLLLCSNQSLAHLDPPGCNANNLIVNIARDKANIVNGAVVTYTITVQNPNTPGTCTASLGPAGLVFTCPGPDGTPSGAQTVLIPGNTLLTPGYGPVQFDIPCTVTLNAGVSTALARIAAPNAQLHDNALGDGSPANIDKTITVNIFRPCIEVTKECVGAPFAYGQPIYFGGVVTNCGDVILRGVTVVDDKAGLVFGPQDLAAGASAPYSGQYTPGGDLCGPHTDTVTASGAASDLDTPVTVTDTASATCPVSTDPCIQVIKVCGPPSIPYGDSYSVSGSVVNCGNVPLVNVVVVDTITDANGDVTTVTIPIGNLAVGETKPVPPQTFSPTLCGPHKDQFTVRAENPCPQGPAVAPAISQECTTTVVCPPCIEVTKGVECRPAAPDDCDSLAPEDFQPSATGVADSENPAFCYRVTVRNCSELVPLEDVTVTDTDENGAAVIASGVSLAPGETREYRYSKSWGVGTHNDTVTATGKSTLDGATATAEPASASVTVLDINIECQVELFSSVDLDGNANDNHVTLPSGSVDTPVQVTLTLRNSGSSPLNVTSVAGLPALVDCLDDVTPVDVADALGLPLNIPANGTVTTVLGCWLASCPSASFSATAHAEASDEDGTLCVYDSSGNIIADESDGCPASVNCEAVVTCRTTGGGTLLPGTVDASCVEVTTTLYPLQSAQRQALVKVTHGGQLGAPYAQKDCGETLGNPCIRGQWQHVRHYQGKGNPRDVVTAFHTVNPKGVFDALNCACLPCCPGEDANQPNGNFNGWSKFELCNPDDHKICGPAPRPAPANALIWTGIGELAQASDTGSKPGEWVVIRVYIEDRSEPGGHHPRGGSAPADIYVFQAWRTGVQVTKKPDFNTVAAAFRTALAQDSCNFLDSLSSGLAPIGTLPGDTVNGVTADIIDKGPLHDGNRQLHPSTAATCE